MTLTIYDRPFDGRLKEVCILREPDGTAASVIVCVRNPDYIPDDQRMAGSRLMPPSPKSGYQSLSSTEYNQILLDAGVTSSPPDLAGSGSAGKKITKNKIEKPDDSNKIHTLVRTQGSNHTCDVEGSDCDIRTKIYALEFYNIQIEKFTKEKLIAAAKQHLNINKSTTISLLDKELNFAQFARERFHRVPKDEEIFDPPNEQVFKTNTKAYDNLKKYAFTDYGAMMIQNFNNSNIKFNVFSAPNTQATATHEHLKLPPDFPRISAYPFTGQSIDPQATIHHEFEHTTFGSAQLQVGSLAEEVKAVVEYENPARIIDGFEPRYVYYQRSSNITINVFNSKTMTGGRTFDPKDPRILK